MMALLTDPSP